MPAAPQPSDRPVAPPDREDAPGRLVVLASGGGTNCQAIIDACAAAELAAEVVAVVTNNAEAGVVARAAAAGIDCRVVDHRGVDPEARRAADRNLIEVVESYEPDLVVLAGWMRILGAEVGARFPMINLHPALPGQFPGIRAIERAHEAWCAGEIDASGVMVHWVPDEGVDVGPVILSQSVPFEAADTLESFAARLHAVEHRLLVDAIRLALA